jgi:6-phosphofructokinase
MARIGVLTGRQAGWIATHAGIAGGAAAINPVLAGHFGAMTGLRSTPIVEAPLEDALREPKQLDPKLHETAELFRSCSLPESIA